MAFVRESMQSIRRRSTISAEDNLPLLYVRTAEQIHAAGGNRNFDAILDIITADVSFFCFGKSRQAGGNREILLVQRN